MRKRWRTVAEALRQSTDQLAAFLATQPNPPTDVRAVARLEAEQLLCFVAKWSRLSLLMALSSELNDHNAAKLSTLLEARLRGEPLQYLLGEAPFLGRLFAVRPGCLIPRPETELLVEKVTEWVHRSAPSAHLLDLGTGTGCIAISIALACPTATVTAIDVSPDALQIATENAVRFSAEVTLVHADGLAWLRALSEVSDASGGHTHRLNALVSNPPYIPSADVEELATEVRNHEPLLALDGGPDGLQMYREISRMGPGMFEPGPAAIFFEVGQGQGVAVMTMFAQSPRWLDWTFGVELDLRGVDRMVIGHRAC